MTLTTTNCPRYRGHADRSLSDKLRDDKTATMIASGCYAVVDPIRPNVASNPIDLIVP